MRAAVVMLAASMVACGSPDSKDESMMTDSVSPATVSLEQFRQLYWIVGSWRGSGGDYPSFFEEYRIVDDSTIQMRALSDSTLTAATDSAMIELRNGTIRKRGTDREYIVIGASAVSIRFARPGETTGGHTFTRATENEWMATLHPSSAGGRSTVYIMRRLNR
jgi:hypothetical protein